MRERNRQEAERVLLDLLAILISERILSASEVQEVQHFIDHDEYGVALHALCWTIEEEDKKVPVEVYEKISRLGREMKLDPEETWEFLIDNIIK